MIAIGWTTLANEIDALKLAHALIEKRLVICAQIAGPIQSIYSWKDSIERSTEYRLTLKFMVDRLQSLESELHSMHPYGIPQWIWCMAGGVSDSYLEWAHSVS
ncbi:MAG: divalent-cation tolerance protein CutA [Opitutales bacterium]|nr:divalent-cation tolerance protein CutA [Opitutales bacterium]